ncbi:MAG: hypothetical protein CENE_01200 [Candidatus Celerinatantimonas neptuna]|nr:MAG: hypothetical protein CENE_01200 [Candidatus Celerinatantimonas neptuna]
MRVPRSGSYRVFLIWIALTLGMTACSMVQVAPYDPNTMDSLQSIDQHIDKLYLTMLTLPEQKRTYQHFSSDYLNLQVMIRALVRMQQYRDNNAETLKQSQLLAKLWAQGMHLHQKKGVLPDFMIRLRQSQYQRLLATMMKGESYKPRS